MRICIIGKFPPIQGGVSMRTYRAAHALAACAGTMCTWSPMPKRCARRIRMYMRAEDWNCCEATYEARFGECSLDRSGRPARKGYIPMASPFVTEARRRRRARRTPNAPFDVIYSHYLEPYGVAGHLDRHRWRVYPMSRAWRGAMPAGSGIIRSSRRSTITS